VALVQSVLVGASLFNRLTEKWGSKGAVLAHGLGELIRHVRAAADNEALVFRIDKHGGRNSYAALLQNALPDTMIVAEQESAACSVYRAVGLERPVRFVIEPRADLQHFCVALASMVSKYLREVLMGEFNRFWQSHVSDLKPTAGYPTDATRFLDAIRPAMERLGVPEGAIWRCK
jgi:ribonuclease HII